MKICLLFIVFTTLYFSCFSRLLSIDAQWQAVFMQWQAVFMRWQAAFMQWQTVFMRWQDQIVDYFQFFITFARNKNCG
jgi:hypothetical protein